MDADSILDPLKPNFQKTLTEWSVVDQSLKDKKTALLVIDLQYLDADPTMGIFQDIQKYNIPSEALDYYLYQLRKVVIPNVRKLQTAFREAGMEVIHTRIQSLTQDGRDRSPVHKQLDLLAAPGSKAAEFLPEVAPVGDEIVINKTASGVFSSTNLQYVLNNLGIKALVVVGVYTNECVSTTVRHGCDLGFYMTLISDACASVTPDLQRSTITTLRDRYAGVHKTTAFLNKFQQLVQS